MLSGESAVGLYAEKALSVLSTASLCIEAWAREDGLRNLSPLPRLTGSLSGSISEEICNSAVEMGEHFFSHHFLFSSLIKKRGLN